MITLKNIETMKFGFVKGKKYRIFSKNKKRKDEDVIDEGIYIGESGIGNYYLMFKSTKNNIIECFLKIDIITGEYIVREV